MKIHSVVSELMQALRGTDGETDMTKLIGSFLTMRTCVKLNTWNVNLSFFPVGVKHGQNSNYCCLPLVKDTYGRLN
jgi:hypothetical protein